MGFVKNGGFPLCRKDSKKGAEEKTGTREKKKKGFHLKDAWGKKGPYSFCRTCREGRLVMEVLLNKKTHVQLKKTEGKKRGAKNLILCIIKLQPCGKEKSNKIWLNR